MSALATQTLKAERSKYSENHQGVWKNLYKIKLNNVSMARWSRETEIIFYKRCCNRNHTPKSFALSWLRNLLFLMKLIWSIIITQKKCCFLVKYLSAHHSAFPFDHLGWCAYSFRSEVILEYFSFQIGILGVI